MPAKNGLTVTSDITVKAREIDFVTRFAKNWDALREILGIIRPIKKQPGTVLTSYTATVDLQDGRRRQLPDGCCYEYRPCQG